MRGILAGGLAEVRAGRLDVEDVVHDLEGQSDCVSIARQRFAGGFGEQRRLAGQRAHQHRGLQQGAGLHAMHALQVRERHVHVADRRQVDRLSAAHARRAGRLREFAHQRSGLRCRQRALRQHLERLGLQGIAGEHGGGLVERHVNRRLAPPQHVVVHARHVVVRKRVRVHVLDGQRGAVERLVLRAGHLAARKDEQRTHPLSTVEHRVAHRLVQPLRHGVGGRQHPLRRGLEPFRPLRGPGVEGDGARARRRHHRRAAHSVPPFSSPRFSGFSRSPSSCLISCSALASRPWQ